MKKKVALLLVLVMIITSLPMIAFGNPVGVRDLATGQVSLHLPGNPTESVFATGPSLIVATGIPAGGPIESLTELANDPVVTEFSDGTRAWYYTQLSIPLSAFAHMPLPITLEISLTGAQLFPGSTGFGHGWMPSPDDSIRLSYNMPTSQPQPPAGISSGLITDMAAGGASTIVINDLTFDYSIPHGQPGSLVITMALTEAPHIGQTATERRNAFLGARALVTAVPHSGPSAVVLGEMYEGNWQGLNLWAAQANRTVTVTGGTPVTFANFLHLNPLRITENHVGTLSGPTLITLTAPAFYRWEVGGFAAAEGYLATPGLTGGLSPFQVLVGNVTNASRFSFPMGAPENFRPGFVDQWRLPASFTPGMWSARGVGSDARHTITFLVNLPRAAAPGLAWIELDGLFLIPDSNARQGGNVNIDVRVQSVNDGVAANPADSWDAGTGSSVNRPNRVNNRTTATGISRGNNNYNYVTSNNVHVGTFGHGQFNVRVHGDTPNLRTGFLRTNINAQETTNPSNTGVNHFRGVRTATLIIEENAAGAFGNGPINFEFLDENGNAHPGIRILGMQARAGSDRNAGWNEGTFNNFPGTNYVGRVSGVPGSGQIMEGRNQNWLTFQGWIGTFGQRPPVHPVVNISTRQATITIPRQAATDTRTAGVLEVAFYLSLEAGFEWKYGSDIEVTISGPGAAAIAEADRTQLLGRAVDPIALREGNSIEVETGTLYNIIGPAGRQRIDDVVIDVINDAAFFNGAELWLYIATDAVGRNFDLNIATIPTISTNEESGLRFAPGVFVANPSITMVGRQAVVFVVDRAPWGGNSPAPVITISNLYVEGQAFPGVEYQIVVSGTGIAQNDQEVFNRVVQQGTEAGAMIQTNTGVFASLPYNYTALENVAGGVWNNVPGVLPGGIARRGMMFWEGMPSRIGLTEPPFLLRIGQDAGVHVSYVMVREFAAFVGDMNPHNERVTVGGESVMTARIDGTASNGSPVSVQIWERSPYADIIRDGATTRVDIAQYIGGASGTVVTPLLIDGRFYLPLRFMAVAFGYQVSWDAGNSVTTVNNYHIAN